MIAALFVEKTGVYSGRDDVDPWDVERDARDYEGPHPVIAHPPCGRWCQLASVNEARYGHPVGGDGGCFYCALFAVRTWGGVLEHPAYTEAWKVFRLLRPARDSWQRDMHTGDWVTEVSQVAYGHPARKRTWLLYHGDNPPPPLDWSEPPAAAQVSYCANHGHSDLPRISKGPARRTPPQFAEVLIGLARVVNRNPP